MSRKGSTPKPPVDPAWSALRVQAIASFGRAVLVAATYGFIAYQARLAIEALAGKQTGASLLLNVAAASWVPETTMATLAALGLRYGIVQRNRRIKQEEEMGRRIRELEEAIDPSRSSSTRIGGK